MLNVISSNNLKRHSDKNKISDDHEIMASIRIYTLVLAIRVNSPIVGTRKFKCSM